MKKDQPIGSVVKPSVADIQANWVELISKRQTTFGEVQRWLDKYANVDRKILLIPSIQVGRIDIVSLITDLVDDVNVKDPFGRSALHYAAGKMDGLALVKLLKDKGAIQFGDNENNTPLHFASNKEVTRGLLTTKNELDLTVPNNNKETVVDLALKNLDSGILEILLEAYKAKIDLEEIKKIITNNSLALAIRNLASLYFLARGKLSEIQILLDQMDPEFRNSNSQNAILVAITAGRKDVVAWLSSKGYSAKSETDFGGSLAFFAIINGQTEMLDYLVTPKDKGGLGLPLEMFNESLGWIEAAIASGQQTMLQKLLLSKYEGGYGFSLKELGLPDQKLLELAIANGKPEMVGSLVNVQGVRPFRDRFFDDTVLVEYAIKCGEIRSLDKLVKPKQQGGLGLPFSLSAFEDVISDEDPFDPISFAVKSGQGHVLDQLVKSRARGGYEFSFSGRQKTKALFLAIEYHRDDIFEKLVTPSELGGYGCPITVQNKRDEDVLGYANRNNLPLFEKLIQSREEGGYGLDYNVENYLRYPGYHHEDKEIVFKHYIRKLKREGREKEQSLWACNYLAHDELIPLIYKVIENNFKQGHCDEQTLFELVDRLKHQSFNFRFLLKNELTKLLVNYFRFDQMSEAQAVVKKLERLNSGEGYLLLADHYVKQGDCVRAFHTYYKVYSNADSALSSGAGVRIVELAVNRKFIFKSDGTLDERVTAKLESDSENFWQSTNKLLQTGMSQFFRSASKGSSRGEIEITLKDLPAKNKSKDDNAMSSQNSSPLTASEAIVMYEYLHASQSQKAVSLRQLLNQTLGVPAWSKENINEFTLYYSKKNASLLNEPDYRSSMDRYLEDDWMTIDVSDEDKGLTSSGDAPKA